MFLVFSELFSTIKTAFTWAIIICVIIFAVCAIRAFKQEKDAQERKRQEQQRRRYDINKIKTASKKWSNEYKIEFLQTLVRQHKLGAFLYKDFGPEFSIVDIKADIDGEIQEFHLNSAEAHEIYNYINEMLVQ